MSEETNEAVSLDQPIKHLAQDQYGRSHFVEHFASSLVNKSDQSATGAVVGLIGEWGSGKSSALNRLEDHLKKKLDDPIILRFEPWLIGDRDALVGNFLADLSSVLAKTKGLPEKTVKKLRELIGDYGGAIGWGVEAVSMLTTATPGLSKLWNGFSGLFSSKDRKSLVELKAELSEQLLNINRPIVVMIDEIDRLDDQEVFEIMRLIKSVADFPRVSYLVAYDVKRVVEALGNGGTDIESEIRGRSYLEKIVQFQVPLPSLFEDELISIFRTNLCSLVPQFEAPATRLSDDRYAQFENTIFPNLIKTPRDLKRVLGSFESLFQIFGEDVNWIDILGYSTLLTKAPRVADLVRSDPIFFTEDFERGGSSMHRYGYPSPTSDEQIATVFGNEFSDR